MHAGECWELATSARIISEIGSGSSRTLPTPVWRDSQQNVRDRVRGKGAKLSDSKTRVAAWEMLPTPTKFDAVGNVKEKPSAKPSSRGALRQQAERLQRWETPSKADAHPRAYNRTGPYTGPHPQKHLQAQAFERSTPLDSPTGKLNPTWVEWLMGWPMQWTDLAPLETDKFRQWFESFGTHWPEI